MCGDKNPCLHADMHSQPTHLFKTPVKTHPIRHSSLGRPIREKPPRSSDYINFAFKGRGGTLFRQPRYLSRSALVSGEILTQLLTEEKKVTYLFIFNVGICKFSWVSNHSVYK